MDQMLSHFIRDPLYRLATWLILMQIIFIVGAIIVAAFLRWLIPKLEARRAEEEASARQVLLQLLSEEIMTDDQAEKLFSKVAMRSIVRAFEQLVTRLGEGEQYQLRGSMVALGIEAYALKLTRSFFWWRRLEGALLLRSVGASPAEERLVMMLSDKNGSVSFYAAWALARVSPERGMRELPHYLNEMSMLSASQKVVLLRELQLDRLDLSEQEELYKSLPINLRPVLIEALILSGKILALPLVRLALTAEENELRIAAFKAAATSRLSLSERELLAGLEDEVWPVRAQAAKAIAGAKAINLIPQLCRALGDDQWWVRLNSAQALVQMGSSGVEALMHVSNFAQDRFARDVARMVLSEVIMGGNASVMNALDTQPISPLPFSQKMSSDTRLLDADRPAALLTNEISLLENSDRLR